MIAVAACCVVRLAFWRRYGRRAEPDVDGVHVLMGVSMAGMLEPGLSALPHPVWQAVFAAAAAWFTWRAFRARGAHPRPGRSRCTHPAPHAVECVAMIYMLLPTHPALREPSMSMPAMSGAAGANPVPALMLAMFMLGYVLWTADQLAAFSRAIAATADGPQAGRAQAGPAQAGPAQARLARSTTAALAPRLAACYKIAMSIAMGYMLIAIG
jgi:hypothetical protein